MRLVNTDKLNDLLIDFNDNLSRIILYLKVKELFIVRIFLYSFLKDFCTQLQLVFLTKEIICTQLSSCKYSYLIITRIISI